MFLGDVRIQIKTGRFTEIIRGGFELARPDHAPEHMRIDEFQDDLGGHVVERTVMSQELAVEEGLDRSIIGGEKGPAVDLGIVILSAAVPHVILAGRGKHHPGI